MALDSFKPRLQPSGARALGALRVIAGLKLKLTLRYYRRNVGNAVAVIISFAVMLLVAVIGGTVLAVFCHTEGPPLRDTVAYWVAWILSLVWLSGPLLQFDAQRNLDLNGLRLFPLPRAAFAFGVLLDGALSPLGLFFIPLLAAAVVALSLSWIEAPVAFGALLLMMACVIGLAQGTLLLLNRLLTSRRWADFSIILGIVLFFTLQGLNLYMQQAAQEGAPSWLLAVYTPLKAWIAPALSWLFPALAARVIGLAGRGEWFDVLWLGCLLALQAVLAVLYCGLAARAFYDGELESGGRAPSKPVARARRQGRPAFGGQLGALFQRERTYLWRDPLLKQLFIQTLAAGLWLSIVLVFTANRGDGGPPLADEIIRRWMLFAAALFIGFGESGLLFNKFGHEGSLATHVLLSPVDRRLLLKSKSLFYLTHFGLLNMLIVAGAGVALKAGLLYTVAAVLLTAHNVVVVDMLGQFLSIYLPFTYRRTGRRLRAVMPQPGCGYMLLYTLVFSLSNAAVLPGAAALVLGAVFGGWGGLLLGAVAAGLIAGTAATLGLNAAARILAAREPELIAALCKTGD